MTYPDDDQVVAAVQQVIAKLKEIPEFENRTVLVFDDEDAMNQLAALKKWPAAVVQYEGMRTNPLENNSPTNRIGAAVILVVSVILINQAETLVKTDTKFPTMLMLGQVRRKMLSLVGPSNHKWKFVVEAPAAEKENLVFWLQRWQLPMILQHVQ